MLIQIARVFFSLLGLVSEIVGILVVAHFLATVTINKIADLRGKGPTAEFKIEFTVDMNTAPR